MALESNTEIGSIRVSTADYLDESNIQLELADGTLKAANYHHWAQSLELECERYLDTRLQTSGDSNAPQIEVEIHRFHGDESGRIILEGRWKKNIVDSPTDATWQFFKLQKDSPFEGYASFVDTHADLLDELCQVILID